jgi:LysM repeat protein
MKFLGWIIALLTCSAVAAQSRLVAGGTGTSLYVSYIVPGGQPLGGVAEQFNVPLAVLAKYNTMNLDVHLRKGEELRIPLLRDNFIQRNIVGKYQPVYHQVKTGDNLSRISQRYNKMTIDTLKRWNLVTEDIVPDGKFLVVGFINNNQALNVTAAYQSIAYDSLPNPNVFDAAKFGAKTLTGEIKPTKIPLPEPPAELPVVVKASNTTDAPENTNTTVGKNKNPGAPIPNPVFDRKPALVAPTLVQTEGNYSYRPRSNDEGYFAYTYNQRIKDRAYQYLTGDASIFKTINGWNDRKFYVLINEIIPGTIVRVTAPNKKSICAKVLGPLPETKGAAGLMIRLSNAAASALGMDDQKFLVSITYVEY